MFAIVATIFFIMAFLIWKRDTTLNFNVKMIMLAMSCWGVYTVVQSI